MSIFHPNGHIRGVPDLLIEIVSSGSVSRDTVEKYAIYEKYGVKEYWRELLFINLSIESSRE